MRFVSQFKRAVAPTVWATLEAVYPTAYWRLKHARKLARAKERELILAPLLCSPEMIAVDVGASDGDYTIRLCQRAKRVVAFEPQPRLAAHLDAMARANALRVQVETVALSDRSGAITMRVPRDDGGRATIEKMNPLGDVLDVDTIEVRTIRLDDYHLSDVCFVKIDVEGHELSVLRGGEQTLRRSFPFILIELEDRHQRNAVQAATTFLNGLGYSGFFMTPGGLVPISDFDPSVHQNIIKMPQPPNYSGIGKTWFNNFLFCTSEKESVLRTHVSAILDCANTLPETSSVLALDQSPHGRRL